MTAEQIREIKEKQSLFFKSGATHSVTFRKNMLKRLYESIRQHEEEIEKALYLDLGKSETEAYMCEVGLTLSEISHLLKNISRYSKEKRVKTPLAQFPAKSYIKPTPYGNTLIMSPWNYPFLLSMSPLATAISAGNTVILKPSAYSPNTSEIIRKITAECFPEDYVYTVTGGRSENQALLSEKFDLIFFTGSGNVGKEVLRHAAENLTPSILELGGKSPCIVDETAKIDLAARRIVFGKFLNCGQTCVAPDYVLCDSRIKDRLEKAIIEEIIRQYGECPLANESYGKIINQRHFDRLIGLINVQKTLHGGKFDAEKLKIEPTVMTDVTAEDAVMKEEIFGPILPILTYEKFDDIADVLYEKDKPLALYLFTENKARIKAVTERIRYGGGCINDTIIHLASSELGFGGVGESGMGKYHGKFGFDSFSHQKSIVKKSTKIDLAMRYQPYKSNFFKRLIRFFLK